MHTLFVATITVVAIFSGCTSAWAPENMPIVVKPGSENMLPQSGTFSIANMDALESLHEFDAAMAVAVQLQPRMEMVTATVQPEYRVATAFSRQPASMKIVQNAKIMIGDIGRRTPFGCRRDIASLDVIITRLRTGERVYAGRARQIVCQGAEYDADSSALAKAALQLP